MVRSLVAVKNHEILGENLAVVLRGIEDGLAVWGESSELFGQEILGEGEEIMAFRGLELDVVEGFDILRVFSTTM